MAGRGRGAVVPAWMKQREAPGSASPNLEQEAEEASENWTEHVAPDGRKYYYNATLKKSSWTKPCVVSPGASPGTDAGSAWEEHKAPDGRTYYYNRATKQSKWNLPPGAAIIPKIAARRGLEAAPSEQKLPMFVPPPGALQPGPTPHFATNAEAKEAFLKMLEVCQIPAWMSWEQVLSLLSTDRRFGGIRSVQERKAVFEEYVARKKEENKADEDARVMEFETKVFAMFDSCSLLKSTPVPKFEDAIQNLSSHPVWLMVSSDKERHELFEKWIDWNEEKIQTEKEEERQKQRRAFTEYLEGCPWISITTTWRVARDKLHGVKEFEILEKFDGLDIFDQYMKKVEERDSASRAIQEEIRLRKESQNRIFLRKLFKEHFDAGLIHARMCWREYLANIGARDEIKSVENNLTGSRPKDLYLDLVEEAERLYERDKPLIEACLRKGVSIEIQDTATYEELRDLVMNCEEGSDIAAESSIKLYHLEVQSAKLHSRKRSRE